MDMYTVMYCVGMSRRFRIPTVCAWRVRHIRWLDRGSSATSPSQGLVLAQQCRVASLTGSSSLWAFWCSDGSDGSDLEVELSFCSHSECRATRCLWLQTSYFNSRERIALSSTLHVQAVRFSHRFSFLSSAELFVTSEIRTGPSMGERGGETVGL